jgi:hypothetical protein
VLGIDRQTNLAQRGSDLTNRRHYSSTLEVTHIRPKERPDLASLACYSRKPPQQVGFDLVCDGGAPALLAKQHPIHSASIPLALCGPASNRHSLPIVSLSLFQALMLVRKRTLRNPGINFVALAKLIREDDRVLVCLS